MSDLSEKIENALKALAEETDSADKVVSIQEQSCLHAIDGFNGIQQHYANEIMTKIRVAYRKHAGEKPFDSPEEALNRIGTSMLRLAVPLLLTAVADGMQIGQGESYVVKKYSFMKKMSDIHDSKSFKQESQLMVVSFMSDYETVEFIEKYVKGSVEFMATKSGFMHAPSELAMKVWDLWNMSLQSSAVGLLAAGHRIGTQYAEDKVLDGILSATESRGEQE